jgi:hypothetical protein
MKYITFPSTLEWIGNPSAFELAMSRFCKSDAAEDAYPIWLAAACGRDLVRTSTRAIVKRNRQQRSESYNSFDVVDERQLLDENGIPDTPYGIILLDIGSSPGPAELIDPMARFLQALKRIKRLDCHIAADRMSSVTVSMQQAISLAVTDERFKYLLACGCCAQRNNSASEQFGVDDDIGICSDKAVTVEATEAIYSRKHFIEYYGDVGKYFPNSIDQGPLE